ncbi:MAG TPA: hypothetical protein VHO47_03030 [Candidatus Babeliales bacterium]|nr:hypothetical protein [Candidatus Babeliales bacterium]
MKKGIAISVCAAALILLIGMERTTDRGFKNESQIEDELRSQEEKRRTDEKRLADERKREDDLRQEQREAEARLEQASANFGPDSKQYTLISRRMAERDGEIADAINNQKAAQKDIVSTEQEIAALTQQLKSLRESPDYKKDQLANSFNSEIQNEIRGQSSDAIKNIIDNKINSIAARSSYAEQKVLLNALIEVARTYNDNEVIDKAQRRIKEIDAFKPQNLATNALERELKLDQKIPMDQIAALDSKTVDLIIAFEQTYQLGNKKEVNRVIQSMQEVKTAVDRYKLKQGTMESLFAIDLAIKASAKMPEIEVFGEISEITEDIARNPAVRAVVQDLTEKGNAIVAAVAQKAIDDVPSIRALAKKSGANLIEYADTIEEIAKVMRAGGGGLDLMVNNLGKVDSLLSAAETVVRLVPVQSARDIGAKVTQLKELLIKKKPLLTTGLKTGKDWTAALSEYGFQLADLVRGFGESLANLRTTDDLDKIAKAQTLIDIEKAKLSAIPSPEKKSRFAQLFTPVTDFFKSISESVRNLFKAKQPTLQVANENYEQSQRNYLTVLGFTQQEISGNPSAAQIQKRLSAALGDPTKQKSVADAQSKLVSATNDLVAIYSDITNQLKGALVNIDYVVTGWDALETNQKLTFAEYVPTIITAHDQRVAYLDAALQGVAILQNDLKALKGTGMDEIATTFADKVASLVSGEMVSTIAEYAQIIRAMDKSLAYQKQELQAAIGQGGGPE